MKCVRVLANIRPLGHVLSAQQNPFHSLSARNTLPDTIAARTQTRGCGKFVTTHTTELTTQDQANDLIRRLKKEEMFFLKTAIQHYESNADRESFEGTLAGSRWRSKFGRPTSTSLGAVDPTGNYCKVPEDWLQKKFAATTPQPTTSQLVRLSVVNGIPFIGFGFLDNAIMIVCGDQIEQTLNGYMCLSTMAAAGLGNTISDVIGIQSAVYVELLAEKMGFKAPPLTQYQLNLKSSRRATNIGRILGITIGCLIGMTPLLFMDNKKKDEEVEEAEAVAGAAPTTTVATAT